MEPTGAPWRVLESPEPGAGAPAEPEADRVAAAPWAAVAVVGVAVVVAVAAFLVAARQEPIVEVDGATVAVTGEAEPGIATPGVVSGTLVVEVSGAVLRPGVYRLAPASRVGDAIAAAGGYAPRVDADLADRQLNLAAQVRDGEEIRVPARGEVAPQRPPAGEGAATGGGTAGGAIDLNTATLEALDTLPGIGPATAAKIIAAREEERFVTVDDLGTRKVVGPATLEKIRALVTVGP
jgi:competence protein ComEA